MKNFGKNEQNYSGRQPIGQTLSPPLEQGCGKPTEEQCRHFWRNP